MSIAVAASAEGRRGSLSRRSDLSGLAAYRAIAHLLFDPLTATRRIALAHGSIAFITPSFAGRRRPMIHVVGADLAEEVFRNYEVFENGGIIFKGYEGSLHNRLRDGYFSANGKEYEHAIKLFGPHFRKKVVEAAHPVIARVVMDELDTWPTGELIDVVPRINRLAKTLASQALFKDSDPGAGIHAADMVERHARLSGASLESAISARFAGTRLHRQARATYDAILDWGKTRRGMPPETDVLATIVNAPTENGCPASPERIAGYGWTMLGAAYDTVTSILAWLFVLIATHPAVARRLHEELRQASVDPVTDMAAIMELPYLDAVIKEALRLIPPAPIQRRKATVETELGGYRVPAGSQVLVSAWMTNRDADLYPNPERFDPDRWAGLARSPYQWLTFSAGPRRCIGMWFALAFLKTILASMMTRWRPDIPDRTRIGLKVAVTVRPVPGIPIVLARPDGNFRSSRIEGDVHRYVQLR